MSLKIETVTVRLTCSPSPYDYPPCDNEACEKCKGTGSYIEEVKWEDFMFCVREALDPGPVSG